jgi:putative cell wall-binding protein
MPYREATSFSLPETSDCLYCHLQEDSSVVEAWASPTQVANHENATTNSDCYSCHVDGGSAPQSFHVASLKLTTGEGPEGPPAGGETAVTPPTSLLQEGINILTADLYRKIILGLGLRYKPFFKSPDTLVASLIMTGKYPRPTNPNVTRTLGKPIEEIYGDVYELAASHSMRRYPYANALVIARGDLPVDSMAAIAYAKAKGVPILLVKPGEVPEVTLEAISKLRPGEIIIVGGPVAVSKAVEDKLTAKAKVKRIEGINRCETAVELAKEIQPDTIVITDAINPSTDAALISYLFDAPLLYVDQHEIPQSVRSYLSQHKTAPGEGKTKVVVVGVGSELTYEIEGIMK